MNEMLAFLTLKLSQKEKPICTESLAQQYVVEQVAISLCSVDFAISLERAEKKIKATIKGTNELFEKDGLSAPFVLKGSSRNLLARGEAFKNLEKTLLLLDEKANDFAERVGRELLKKIGCPDEKVHITPRTRDEGIDYWGDIYFPSILSFPSHRILVIGQVKQYSGSIPVSALREFVGAAKTALATKFFGEIFSEHSPAILQFVTTGELTESSRNVAEINNIHIITKRHLIEMGILKVSEDL